MLRKSAVPALICVLALAVGCRKKTENDMAPVPAPGPDAPAGMTSVPVGKQAVFITEAPVTVGQYVEFLMATGQELPEQFVGDSVGMNDPVTGLDIKQAVAYAKWRVLRLPTELEWAKSVAVVGPVPYPWAPGDPGPREDAKLYLVRDWEEGAATEAEVKKARDELLASMLEDYTAMLQQAKNDAAARIEDKSADIAEAWQSAKAAVFNRVAAAKQTAEQATRGPAMEDIVSILDDVVLKKRDLATKTGQGIAKEPMEAATKQYDELVAAYLGKVRATKEELQKTNQQLQAEAVALKQELDQSGDRLAGQVEHMAGAYMEQLAELATDLTKAPLARDVSAKMQQAVEETTTSVTNLIAGLGEGSDTPGGEEPVPEAAQRLGKLKKDLAALGEFVTPQVLNETQLLKDLDELLHARMLRKALQAEIGEVKKLLRTIAGAGAMPPGPPGEQEPDQDVEPPAPAEPESLD